MSGIEAGNGRFSYFCCLQIGFIRAELKVFIIDGGILNLSFLFCLIVAYSRNFGVSPLIICSSCEFVCKGRGLFIYLFIFIYFFSFLLFLRQIVSLICHDYDRMMLTWPELQLFNPVSIIGWPCPWIVLLSEDWTPKKEILIVVES